MRATDLVPADSNGLSDPYVVLTLNGTSVRSKTIPKTLNPVWEELFSLPVKDLDADVLHVQVMDWDRVSKDDPIGDASVALTHLVQEVESDVWAPLTNVASGRVHLTLMPINCGRQPDEGKAKEVSGDVSPPQSKKERKLAKKAKRKLLLTKREEPSRNIIDIVVLEGLGLARPGKSAIDPYCVVRVGSAVYVTSVKRGAASCIWNEDCSFELTGDDASDVHITVINEKGSHQPHTLGGLRVPLASVRDENGGEARLYPLELKETAATGYLRLQLQLNSVSTGILAHFGAPLCASMPMRVNVGDLLLFSCTHVGAVVTKVGTGSTWDHVAMVVKPQYDDGDADQYLGVFESCPSGVRVARYLDSYCNAYFDAGAKIALRRLTAERHDLSLEALTAFVKQMDGKPYEKNLMEMVRGTMSLNSGEDLSGVFCSELVAAAYQRMGLLEATVSSNNFMPGHFGKPQMPLQRGASLGPLVFFKPKRIKPAALAAAKLASPSSSS